MSNSSPLDKSGMISEKNRIQMSPPFVNSKLKPKRFSLKDLKLNLNTETLNSRASRQQLMEAHQRQINLGFFMQKSQPKNINYSTNTDSILDSHFLMTKIPSAGTEANDKILATEQFPDVMTTSAEYLLAGNESSSSSEYHYDLNSVSACSPDPVTSDVRPRIIFY